MFEFNNKRVLSIWGVLIWATLVSVPAQAAVNANFTWSPANPRAGQPIQFTDTSTGNPTSWQWDFQNPPNGTDSTQQNPVWTYNAPGTYRVKLTAAILPSDIDVIEIDVVVDPAGNPGNLSFTTGSYSVNEGTAFINIPIRRLSGSSGPASVRCRTSNGTATAGQDYTTTNVVLNWADGDAANKNCRIQITNDSVDEPNETLNLALSDFMGASEGNRSNATLTIIDNDPPPSTGTLSFSTGSYSVNEGTAFIDIPIRRLSGSSGPASVRCRTSNGTATAGQDYTTTNAVLNWADGDASNKNCRIQIINDSIDEPNETVNLALSDFMGASEGNQSNAPLTIIDNDPASPAGTLSFSTDSYSVNESTQTIDIAIRRLSGSSGPASARCRTSNGTATAGQDYTTTNVVLNWADGDASNKICTVQIIDDNIDEPNETVNLVLSDFMGASEGNQSNAVLTIIDNDPAPSTGTLRFSTDSYSVNESTQTIDIPVRRLSGSSGPASVRCRTSNDTATAGQDYTTTNVVLNWLAGDASNKICTVQIIDDNIDEPNETVNLVLSDFMGASEGNQSNATLTIIDNDNSSGELSFSSATYQVEEDVGIAMIPVTRTEGSEDTVSVRCSTSNGTAIAGQDYTATVMTLTWGNGDTSDQFCKIPINNDETEEGSETINLLLSNFEGGATAGEHTTAILAILPNDSNGELSFDSATYQQAENGGSASMTVRRTGGSDGEVSVRCDTADGTATAGEDYLATQLTLTWMDGETSNKTCIVPIIDDQLVEGDETVNLMLTNFTGGAGPGPITSAVLTILDDEDAGTVRFTDSTYTVSEDAGIAEVAVERIGSLDGPVSIRCDTTSGGTATSEVDYEKTMDTLTWGAGEGGEKLCEIPILKDSIPESDETVNLSLENPIGGVSVGSPSIAVLTIVSEDLFANSFEQGDLCRWTRPVVCGTILSFKSANYEVSEGPETAEIIVERRQSFVGAVSVRCDTSPGTATTDDYTETMQVLNWADGETGDKVCNVPITDDMLYEVGETVNLALSNAMGGATILGQTTAQLTILESDPIKLQFASASSGVEESVGLAPIAVQRLGGTNGQVSVTCSTTGGGTANAGDDYSPAVEILTWADGDTDDKNCPVSITNDSTGEPDETVNLALTNPTGAGAELGTPNMAILTINDDETGLLNFEMATYEFDESVGIATVLVTRSNGTSGIATASCTKSNGTSGTPATAVEDYDPAATPLMWGDGEDGAKPCTISISSDSVGEDDETVDLALENFGGATPGATTSAVLTILDDETGELDFEQATYEFDESVGIVTVRITRTNGTSGPASVQCTTSNGTAMAGSDYEATSDLLSWDDEEGEPRECTIPIINDTTGEPDEEVNVGMTNLTGAVFGSSNPSAVLTIFDDETGELDFEMATYMVDENIGTATVMVIRDNGSSGPASVICNTSNGSATAGEDYTATMEMLTWVDMEEGPKLCNIPILDDMDGEPDETINLSLTMQSGAVIGDTHPTAVLTINDDETGEIDFEMATYMVDENIGTATVMVIRDNGSSGPASVICNTSNGSATAGEDYTATMEMLTWVDMEEGPKPCNIPITNDNTGESDETVNLALSNVAGAAIGTTQPTAQLTINDDETGVLNFDMATYEVNEDAGMITVMVSRINGSSGEASTSCNTSSGGTATAGQDYTTTMVPLNWTDTEDGAKPCTIPIIDDMLGEPNETVNLTLAAITGAMPGTITTAVLTILDNELSELNFDMATYEVDENIGIATVMVVRSGSTAGTASVRCNTSDGTATTADNDYTATTDLLSWADTEGGPQPCTIPINNDTDPEQDETVNLGLDMAMGAEIGSIQSTAILTINDDETGVLDFEMATYEVDEGAGTATVSVSRSGGTSGPASVSCANSGGFGTGIATPGVDYTELVIDLSWADLEEGAKNCTFMIEDDSIGESDETVSLILENETGAALGTTQTSTTLTINDNEIGEVNFTTDAYSVDEDAGMAIIPVERTNGTAGEVTVRCDTADGTAEEPGDYEETMDVLTWTDGVGGTMDCTVPIVDDGIVPPADGNNETVMLSLTTAIGGVTIGSQGTATLTIRGTNTLRFDETAYDISEDGLEVAITIQRDVAGDETTVRCLAKDDTATEGEDFTSLSQSLTWLEGEIGDKTCILSILDDDLGEIDETVALELVDLLDGESVIDTATLTIWDNEPSAIDFAEPEYTAKEDVESGLASVDVLRTGDSSGTVSIRCDSADAEAFAGSDYETTIQMLEWPAGENGMQRCEVVIMDDEILEGGESLKLLLSNAVGTAAGAQSEASLNIVDDEYPGDLSFSQPSQDVMENAGTAKVEVRRIGGSGGEITVRCDTVGGTAIAEQHFKPEAQTLTWKDGDIAPKTCSVTILDNAEVTADETVRLILNDATGGASTVTPSSSNLKILDDDGISAEGDVSMHILDESAIGCSKATVHPGLGTVQARGPVGVTLQVILWDEDEQTVVFDHSTAGLSGSQGIEIAGLAWTKRYQLEIRSEQHGSLAVLPIELTEANPCLVLNLVP